MEKLRATWIKDMYANHEQVEPMKYFSDEETAQYHQGQADAYEKVLRDSEWFNEEFSKLLAEVTEAHQNVKRIYQREPNTATLASLKYLERTKDKLERLEQGKEVKS